MSNESRDHYHEDGNLVPNPRCGFGFEAVFQLCSVKLNISVYLIGPNNVGPNFRRPKYFVGPNFRHLVKISSLRADE